MYIYIGICVYSGHYIYKIYIIDGRALIWSCLELFPSAHINMYSFVFASHFRIENFYMMKMDVK